MTVAYLFPGQNSHQVGMGRDVYARYPAARAVYDKADAFLEFPLSQLCFEGDSAELTKTINQQPAIFVTSLANWAVIQAGEWPRAAYMAGHSMGEITALTAAGSISFYAGLQLVRERGRLMQAAGEKQAGGMMAILALSAEKLEVVCRQAAAETGLIVQIANDNCPGQLIISGHIEALALAATLAKEAGARKITQLDISVAGHSPLMADVATAFGTLLADTPVNTPQVPVISNLTAEPLPAPRRIRAELQHQITQPVRWTESMQTLVKRGVDTFIEVGPSNVLTQLLKRIDRSVTRKTFTVPELSPAGECD